MSYQVLARKWRPQTFHELVGQSHVKQALVNALTQNRLHHAYLFTGTRGVGKTTIARIFAKSLNCDKGISAEPCGQCSSCTDIEAGRYIDLLEIDAASRTKVEDTREILDNVQYAPTRGRYKVYLIDEVHMLSKHSFNALLKTLEEPPEHVKFLLATTDPQKLPVTILSRCLQFNLNALSQSEIHDQLAHVLNQEQLSFDDKSLSILAKAADGSMRDALSLTDQAIAQTNGNINHQAVQTMLGLMDTHYSQTMLAAVLCQDGDALLAEVKAVVSRNPNFVALLDDLIALTHLIQLVQLVPSAAALDETNRDFIEQVAQTTDAQQMQVYYQLLLNGKKDLQWAPDAKLGFEMIMLRLLAFQPTQFAQSQTPTNSQQQVKPSGAGALRDILKKSSAQREQAASEQTSTAVNQAPLQPQPIKAEPTVTQAAAPQIDLKPEQKVDNTAEQSQQPSQSFDTSGSSDKQSAASLYQQNSTDTPDMPATEYYDDYDAQMDSSLAAQYDDVMSSAYDQGFIANEPDVQPLPQAEQTAPVQLQQQQSLAQSAIARILKDRNISGAGRLSGAASQTDIKPEPAESTVHEPTQHGSASTNFQPQQQTVAADVKKPSPQPTGESSHKVKKVDFKAKHQTITENLAPELLEQINPQKAPEPVAEEPSIPVPDDFESPISSIKFAHEQDEWAYLIKRMGLGGRMRQFALHSIFTKNDRQLHIEVDSSQRHLDSAVLRQKLNAALSEIYGHNVELNIDFADGVIDSPYLIQQKIDAGRHQQAIDVINSDENIVQFQQLFSAIIDENSIQAL
ncbi:MULTISPECIES: DNA polymerase III subunit gamma/tau [Pseudoalteromonas]|jgi:DNA polymerase-3 subunit gamma/tau|uniref:DNA polymerase III subunit gamma/tau n=1 Tax=Pseudoalteromonas lipolytica TaxID=570156 RepID=A0AAD0RZU8_9GAMM|nr:MULTISPECIES: DNA polymerase III subunit gamma/tau [Pseudoalteromonas]AXV65595.1 DNA polymerase III subunit gamma/tau [Pseudoalteromonas donghaensis]MAE02213.1 DNA polymerase III subunit gamma/tau [Pseudoalteromonas sp.]QMW13371.1 DNA polymerase III subunit gamma/tau [Pseudoalteromonas sp. MT33b]QPL41764.1 DNA polymerase III subunit gamma/tau [Pseudoalteromonas sp. A41-2]|tara:strand:+ start:2803 stop:5190 length:2388 start_codon:yes stop_codon:yes gene_type:complete